MKKTQILILILSIIFISCENVYDVEVNINHEEFIVVQSTLVLNDVFPGVTITKTLPINETYNIKKAEVKDAIVYLKLDGVQVIPLHYKTDGVYLPKNEIRVKSKTTYELFALVDQKQIYSSTIIPEKPEVISVSMHNDEYLTAEIMARPDECYGAEWLVGSSSNSIIDKAEDFYSVTAASSQEFSIIVRTQNIPAKYRDSFYNDKKFIRVYTFDKAYLAYFKSKGNNNFIENAFTQNGGEVAWNVYGDHVIGLFIGINYGLIIKP